MKEDIRAVYRFADQSDDLGAIIQKALAVFEAHPDELADVTGAIRLTNTDTGDSWGFRLESGVYAPLADEDKADVCVLGKTEGLLGVLKRSINPVKALLKGQVKVQGKKKLLLRLAEFL